MAIDTGAHATGFLTAAVIDSSDARHARFLVGAISPNGIQVEILEVSDVTTENIGR